MRAGAGWQCGACTHTHRHVAVEDADCVVPLIDSKNAVSSHGEEKRLRARRMLGVQRQTATNFLADAADTADGTILGDAEKIVCSATLGGGDQESAIGRDGEMARECC